MARPAERGASPLVPTGGRVPWALLLLGLLLLALVVFPFISMLSALPRAEHAALLSRDTASAVYTTVVAAVAAIALDALFGIPLAYWMATTRSRLRHVALIATLLPLAVPPVVGGLELVLWLGPYGWLGRLLDHIGLNPLNSIRGTILADMFVAAPFVIVTARAAFATLEPGVADAARSLGAGPWRVLLAVRLPLARRGIVAGLALGWLRAAGEFGTSIIVAYHPYTLANLTYVQLSEQGLRTALPTGALLAAFGIAAAVVLLVLDADRRRTRPAPAPAPALKTLDAPPTPAPTPAPTPQPVPPAPPPAPGATPAAAGVIRVRVAGRAGAFPLDVDFEAPATAVALLGSSGAGKSLTLRTVAGLLRPPVGRVELGGSVLLDIGSGTDIPAERRQLGYVAQDGALFRHLDVEGNVAFGLHSWTAADRAARVDEMIATFGLAALRHARPERLSGGERQQVALARALAPRPRALLLDEPFSSLDATLRRSLRDAVRSVYEQTGIPFVLVTHDRDDALDLADYVVMVDGGRVVQQGGIDEVFAHPATPTVARLAGIPNVLAVRELESAGAGSAAAHTPWGAVAVTHDGDPAGTWAVAVPADAVSLGKVGSAATVAASRPGPTHWRVTLASVDGGGVLVAAIPRNGGPRPAPGSACWVSIDGARCQLMPLTPATLAPATLAPANVVPPPA
ncbi:MAG TPA: ATP-binding cassette domain-containing protein [Actinomycetota bacterium]|nr:ATP-binding cassette domain-containing protein [Actinomycetota bacterium]